MYIIHPDKRFMARFERYEPIIQDSTAMKLLKRCDRKYFYRIVLGRTPKNNYNQVVLDAGTIYHKFREILGNEWKKHQDAPKALKVAIEHCMDMDLAMPQAMSKWTYVDKTMLMQALAHGYKHWMLEKSGTAFEVLDQELPWTVVLPDGSVSGGRLDELTKWRGLIWPRDFKFTSKDQATYQKLVDPNDQATRYIHGLSKTHGQDVQGIIFECLYHHYTKSKGLELSIYSVTTQRTRQQLQVWEDAQIHLNRQLKVNREFDIWPMRELSGNFDSKGCEWCEYADVCRRSSEVSMMSALETNYKLSPWNCVNTTQVDIDA